VDCEFTDKVEEIVDEIRWENLVAKDWRSCFTLSFKGVLNSLSNDNEDSKNIWRKYFSIVCQGVSLDKYRFIPMQSTSYASIPPSIKLEFLQAGGNTTPHEFAEHLQSTILPIARQKLSKLSGYKHYKIGELADRIQTLITYLRLWDGENMTYQRYFQMRSIYYRSDIQQLEELLREYLNSTNTDQLEHITDVIRRIEYSEIVKIYASNIFKDNLSIITLLGYLSELRPTTVL
jgi:hypothetical protein